MSNFFVINRGNNSASGGGSGAQYYLTGGTQSDGNTSVALTNITTNSNAGTVIINTTNMLVAGVANYNLLSATFPNANVGKIVEVYNSTVVNLGSGSAKYRFWNPLSWFGASYVSTASYVADRGLYILNSYAASGSTASYTVWEKTDDPNAMPHAPLQLTASASSNESGTTVYIGILGGNTADFESFVIPSAASNSVTGATAGFYTSTARDVLIYSQSINQGSNVITTNALLFFRAGISVTGSIVDLRVSSDDFKFIATDYLALSDFRADQINEAVSGVTGSLSNSGTYILNVANNGGNTNQLSIPLLNSATSITSTTANFYTISDTPSFLYLSNTIYQGGSSIGASASLFLNNGLGAINNGLRINFNTDFGINSNAELTLSPSTKNQINISFSAVSASTNNNVVNLSFTSNDNSINSVSFSVAGGSGTVVSSNASITYLDTIFTTNGSSIQSQASIVSFTETIRQSGIGASIADSDYFTLKGLYFSPSGPLSKELGILYNPDWLSLSSGAYFDLRDTTKTKINKSFSAVSASTNNNVVNLSFTTNENSITSVTFTVPTGSGTSSNAFTNGGNNFGSVARLGNTFGELDVIGSDIKIITGGVTQAEFGEGITDYLTRISAPLLDVQTNGSRWFGYQAGAGLVEIFYQAGEFESNTQVRYPESSVFNGGGVPQDVMVFVNSQVAGIVGYRGSQIGWCTLNLSNNTIISSLSSYATAPNRTNTWAGVHFYVANTTNVQFTVVTQSSTGPSLILTGNAYANNRLFAITTVPSNYPRPTSFGQVDFFVKQAQTGFSTTYAIIQNGQTTGDYELYKVVTGVNGNINSISATGLANAMRLVGMSQVYSLNNNDGVLQIMGYNGILNYDTLNPGDFLLQSSGTIPYDNQAIGTIFDNTYLVYTTIGGANYISWGSISGQPYIDIFNSQLKTNGNIINLGAKSAFEISQNFTATIPTIIFASNTSMVMNNAGILYGSTAGGQLYFNVPLQSKYRLTLNYSKRGNAQKQSFVIISTNQGVPPNAEVGQNQGIVASLNAPSSAGDGDSYNTCAVRYFINSTNSNEVLYGTAFVATGSVVNPVNIFATIEFERIY